MLLRSGEEVTAQHLQAEQVKMKRSCVSILESKSSDFYFDNNLIWKRGKISKISSKYQNPDDHQNIKTTALSTPNFARKASFFSIFKDQILQENHTENWQTRQILQKILRTKFQNTKISGHILIFCPFLVLRYFTSIMDFYFENFKSASPVRGTEPASAGVLRELSATFQA